MIAGVAAMFGPSSKVIATSLRVARAVQHAAAEPRRADGARAEVAGEPAVASTSVVPSARAAQPVRGMRTPKRAAARRRRPRAGDHRARSTRSRARPHHEPDTRRTRRSTPPSGRGRRTGGAASAAPTPNTAHNTIALAHVGALRDRATPRRTRAPGRAARATGGQAATDERAQPNAKIAASMIVRTESVVL